MTTILLVMLATAPAMSAQVPAQVWRTFVERIDVGSELNVRLSDGRRFRATLIGVNDDAVLLQPRTRVPVPVQAVAYDEIVRLERAKAGIGAGKAVAIGAVTGVGAFFGTLIVMLALVGD